MGKARTFLDKCQKLRLQQFRASEVSETGRCHHPMVVRTRLTMGTWGLSREHYVYFPTNLPSLTDNCPRLGCNRKPDIPCPLSDPFLASEADLRCREDRPRSLDICQLKLRRSLRRASVVVAA